MKQTFQQYISVLLEDFVESIFLHGFKPTVEWQWAFALLKTCCSNLKGPPLEHGLQ